MARCLAEGWGTYAGGDAPGLSFFTIPWLANHNVAAVASDTWGVEVRPNELPDSFQPFHIPTVVYMGLLLGEMFDLEELAADCAADGVWEFLFVAPPLTVSGAVGFAINPQAVEAQDLGAATQGLGGALYEELVYDDSAQLLTGSFLDYLVPTAMEVPRMDNIHLHTPSERNPLGVKGVGEGGAISPPAAISNAIEDALAPFGVRVTGTPVSPSRVMELLRQARESDGR